MSAKDSRWGAGQKVHDNCQAAVLFLHTSMYSRCISTGSTVSIQADGTGCPYLLSTLRDEYTEYVHMNNTR